MTKRHEKSPVERPGFLNGAQSIPTWWAKQEQTRTFLFILVELEYGWFLIRPQ
ncbi:hypothetical protein [Candidatus Allofournierella merdipullorum]|uniref:hypothetical protein n=1 Tax=Candidatus Allofournierella merdipullorum TaxID=2838595 RepID=UPI00374F9F21